jgi:hypothetical protein
MDGRVVYPAASADARAGAEPGPAPASAAAPPFPNGHVCTMTEP